LNFIENVLKYTSIIPLAVKRKVFGSRDDQPGRLNDEPDFRGLIEASC